jgi:hypothetical protein
MTPRAAARVSLLLTLFACNERAGVAELVKVEPNAGVGEKEPPGEPPAPGRLPAGTPTAQGRIDLLLALDGERAVVRFLVPGPDHEKLWWLALMRRDGSVDWVQPLSGMLAHSEDLTLVRAGDAVSIATSDISGSDPVVTLRGFALADGAPRFTTVLGTGFITNTRTDGQTRFDTRVQYNFSSGGETEGELTATSPQGVVWRARVGAPIPVGHDPTIVGDAIAVRTEPRRSRATTWQVFERASGKPRGELVAEPQSCSDGQRWFVRGAEGLLAVDPATVTTRVVLAPPTLPGADGTWVIEDCTLSDDVPVVLVARGHRKALVALDPQTLGIKGHVEIGATSVGMNGFDPLPARARGVLALRTLAGESDELLIADPSAGKVVGRWRSKAEFGSLAGRAAVVRRPGADDREHDRGDRRRHRGARGPGGDQGGGDRRRSDRGRPAVAAAGVADAARRAGAAGRGAGEAGVRRDPRRGVRRRRVGRGARQQARAVPGSDGGGPRRWHRGRPEPRAGRGIAAAGVGPSRFCARRRASWRAPRRARRPG